MRSVPQVGHRQRLSDQHARSGPRGLTREGAAPDARRNDVHAQMTEGAQVAVLRQTDEAPETATRDVLEEHALHGILRAEPEDLLAPGLDELGRQARNCSSA